MPAQSSVENVCPAGDLCGLKTEVADLRQQLIELNLLVRTDPLTGLQDRQPRENLRGAFAGQDRRAGQEHRGLQLRLGGARRVPRGRAGVSVENDTRQKILKRDVRPRPMTGQREPVQHAHRPPRRCDDQILPGPRHHLRGLQPAWWAGPGRQVGDGLPGGQSRGRRP